MEFINCSDETSRNSHFCKYDEISIVGMVWAAIMTLIALIQLSLF
jgi:hypothetical protein